MQSSNERPKVCELKLQQLRALRRSHAKNVRTYATVIRKASAALMRLNKELKQAKDALCETEEERGLYDVSFEPYGNIETQTDVIGEVTCPGFDDIRDTMKDLVEECDRVLGGDAPPALPSELWDV